MSKKKAGLTVIVSLAVVSTIVFSVVMCGSYTYKEGDFSLTITVDKTELRVGDTIEVTVTFKNLSGRKHRIIHPAGDIMSMVSLKFVPKGEELSFGWVLESSSDVMEKSAVLEDKFSWEVRESGEYCMAACAYFRIVRSYYINLFYGDVRMDIYSPIINIIIQE